MWKQYEELINGLCTSNLGETGSAAHLSPGNSFVWRATDGDRSYIIKIEPQKPYRLRRELQAYIQFSGSHIRHAKLVAHGICKGIPYLILSDCGGTTAAGLFAGGASRRSLDILRSAVGELCLLSCQNPSPFAVIRDGLTTRDRDSERLQETSESDLRALNKFGDLFERIREYIDTPYKDLCHRELFQHAFT